MKKPLITIAAALAALHLTGCAPMTPQQRQAMQDSLLRADAAIQAYGQSRANRPLPYPNVEPVGSAFRRQEEEWNRAQKEWRDMQPREVRIVR